MKIVGMIFMIALGLLLIFVIVPILKKKTNAIKNLTIRKVADVLKSFNRAGLPEDYMEVVALDGFAKATNLYKTPFTKTEVAFVSAKAVQVSEEKENYKDADGNNCTRVVNKRENIFDMVLGDSLDFVDDSTGESVVLDMKYVHDLEIKNSYNEFKEAGLIELGNFGIQLPINPFGNSILGFELKENTIDNNEHLFIVGAAYKKGEKIHITCPKKSSCKFVVTNKQKEEYVKSAGKSNMALIILGIFLIVTGIVIGII